MLICHIKEDIFNIYKTIQIKMDELFDDHGLYQGDRDKSYSFLYNNNILGFLLFVIAVITAQLWYDVIKSTVVPKKYSYKIVALAILFTSLTFLLSVYIFKVPIAGIYTL